MRNAIILAAGKSNRFAPFTYEKPKGLFRVKDEILIERQIKQLNETGIKDIYIVVGYMKEKFFYLEQKYGVHLIVNNTFANKGNLYSLYVARKYLHDSFVICADQYFIENPFLFDNKDNHSYRACSFQKGKFKEFGIKYSDASVITEMTVGGENQMAMIGHAYFNDKFSKKFVEFMEQEIDDFGVSNMFWEEFYAKHQKELTLYMKEYGNNDILEFDNIDDLRQFDSEFLINVDSDIITNIRNVLKCNPNEIIEIEVIQAGLTNVSFSFTVKNIKYVYRHPGGTAGSLINREAELFAQKSAKELEIDKSVIYMDLSGWKISYFVKDIIRCDFMNNKKQLKMAMRYLREIHNVKVTKDIKVFDDVKEGKKLMKIASSTKGNLFNEFKDIIEKIERLDILVKEESKVLGYENVLCHNDTYEPNYLATENEDLYLIDWEYAGLNDPTNDIACILCREDYSDEEIEIYLNAYYDRKLTEMEHRHCISYIAICGFYWFCWGLYKGSVGDDDGFFFLPAYRNMLRYLDKALESYEVK